VQETVNSHPFVADCVACPPLTDSAGTSTTLHVVPEFQERGVESDTKLFSSVETQDIGEEAQETLATFSNVNRELLNIWLVEEKGYTGPELPVVLMTESRLLRLLSTAQPAAAHKRLVLRDLVRVVFEAVDSDGDGEITAQELVNWMETQHIDIDNPMEAFFAADRAENALWEDTLGLAEFKQLMLAEDLIGMEGEGRVGVQVRHGCGPPTRSAIILSKRRVLAGCAARCGGGPDLCEGGCRRRWQHLQVRDRGSFGRLLAPRRGDPPRGIRSDRLGQQRRDRCGGVQGFSP